jgi:hypothetical protein
MMDYQEIAQKKFEELGPPVIIFGYMAHLIDLQAQLIKDLSGAVDETKLSDAAKARLSMLDNVLAASSIDFANIDKPEESYKIPDAIKMKKNANLLMINYLTALMRSGVF